MLSSIEQKLEICRRLRYGALEGAGNRNLFDHTNKLNLRIHKSQLVRIIKVLLYITYITEKHEY